MRAWGPRDGESGVDPRGRDEAVREPGKKKKGNFKEPIVKKGGRLARASERARREREKKRKLDGALGIDSL